MRTMGWLKLTYVWGGPFKKHIYGVVQLKAYMGGLALMIISQKNWEFLPFFMSTLWIIQPHFKSFIDLI